MKKILSRLMIFSIIAPALTGCSLPDFFGGSSSTTSAALDADKEVKSLNLRDYTAKAVKDSKYEFDGKAVLQFVDGTEADVTKDKRTTYTTLDTSSTGEKDYKVTYEGDKYFYSSTAKIEVVAPAPTRTLSEISASGYTTEVNKKDTYTFDGVVTATYTNGDTEDVTSLCTFSSVSTTSTGTKSLKITYKEGGVTKSIYVKITVVQRVTGISVNEELSVSVGKNKPLGASVIPSDATNKGLSYSSNKPSVASVDANGQVRGESEGNAVITVTSKENSSISKQVNVTVETKVVDKWTILLYVCGSNLESDDADTNEGAATLDLQEIASVDGQPNNVNVVVQAGGANSWSAKYSSVISASKRNRFHLRNNTYVSDSQDTRVNMGDSASLQEFIEWGLDEYPAYKVGLVIWNHGGALTGCCHDEQSNDMLTTAEVDQAITAAKTNAGYTDKFEFIGYDCCLMQVQDIAGLNAKHAKYQVASEESEWGYGWAYEYWIDDVYADHSTATICSEIVRGFEESTSEVYDYYHKTNEQTLSYIDLSYWDSYKTAWEDMASTLSSVVSSKGWSKFSSLMKSCQRFGYGPLYDGGPEGYFFDVFDVGSFLTKIQSNSNFSSNSTLMTKIQAIESIYGNLVGEEWHGAGSSGATGLTMFAPVCGYSSTSDYTTSGTPFTVWRNFCINQGSWY